MAPRHTEIFSSIFIFDVVADAVVGKAEVKGATVAITLAIAWIQINCRRTFWIQISSKLHLDIIVYVKKVASIPKEESPVSFLSIAGNNNAWRAFARRRENPEEKP